VIDAFLSTNKIDKISMTLVDEERQFNLLDALKSHSNHVKRSCGDSACNSIVTIKCFGLDIIYCEVVAILYTFLVFWRCDDRHSIELH